MDMPATIYDSEPPHGCRRRDAAARCHKRNRCLTSREVAAASRTAASSASSPGIQCGDRSEVDLVDLGVVQHAARRRRRAPIAAELTVVLIGSFSISIHSSSGRRAKIQDYATPQARSARPRWCDRLQLGGFRPRGRNHPRPTPPHRATVPIIPTTTFPL